VLRPLLNLTTLSMRENSQSMSVVPSLQRKQSSNAHVGVDLRGRAGAGTTRHLVRSTN